MVGESARVQGIFARFSSGSVDCQSAAEKLIRFLCVGVHTQTQTHTHTLVGVQRERERERETYTQTHTHRDTHTLSHTLRIRLLSDNNHTGEI